MPSLNLTGSKPQPATDSAARPAGRSAAKQVIVNTHLNTEYASELTLRERQEALNHYEALYRQEHTRHSPGSRWTSEGRASNTDTVQRQPPSAPRRANQAQDTTPTPPRRGRC